MFFWRYFASERTKKKIRGGVENKGNIPLMLF